MWLGLDDGPDKDSFLSSFNNYNVLQNRTQETACGREKAGVAGRWVKEKIQNHIQPCKEERWGRCFKGWFCLSDARSVTQSWENIAVIFSLPFAIHYMWRKIKFTSKQVKKMDGWSAFQCQQHGAMRSHDQLTQSKNGTSRLDAGEEEKYLQSNQRGKNNCQSCQETLTWKCIQETWTFILIKVGSRRTRL